MGFSSAYLLLLGAIAVATTVVALARPRRH